ncbi:MAG: 50S ribosomal protein L17 [Bacteroidales bacterium]|nr:50S ribosomal protein L17 [Bacteroidales bacterium]
MRHGKKINHLGRKTGHRRAMLANMANSLILHKRLQTTVAKAKALRVYVEPLITKSKDDSTHSRRVVFSYLQNKETVSELFRDISSKVANRPGGYTRILKTGNRIGDNAEMCIIELVDYNETYVSASDSKATAKKSRRRRGGKKTDEVDETKPQTQAKAKAKTETKSQESQVEIEETVVDVVEENADLSKTEESEEIVDNSEEPTEKE